MSPNVYHLIDTMVHFIVFCLLSQLYLDGKIREWYSREDAKGGVFLLNTGDVEEAKPIMESLPLAKEDMLDHEYILVGPLDAVTSANGKPVSQALTQGVLNA